MPEFSEPENYEDEFAFWVEHAPNDDPRVLSVLINRYAPDVIWLLDSLLDVFEIHRDVKIEPQRLAAIVFQRAWKQLDRFRGFDSMRNWFYKEAIEEFWKNRQKNRSSWRSSEQSNPLVFSLYPKETGTEGQIDLQKLCDQERLVFFLRYAANLKVPEIAQVSGMHSRIVYQMLFDTRKKFGVAHGMRKIKPKYEDMHARVQLETDARLDGYSLTSISQDGSHLTHLFYCPQCNQYLEKRKLLDDVLIKACQKQWTIPDLNPDQIEYISRLAFQMLGKAKPWSNYRRHSRDAVFFGFVFLIVIAAGVYFSSQDSDAGIPMYDLKQGATPTAAVVNEVPIRRVLQIEKAVYVSDEFGNLMSMPVLESSENVPERDYTLFESDESISSNCLSISPLDNLLATCSYIGRVNLWSIEEKRLLISMKGHTMPVTNVSFSPDGSLLAAGSHDGKITLWQTMDGTELTELPGNSGAVLSVSFSPNGKYLSVGAVAAGWIWELNSGEFNLVDYFTYPGEQVNDVAYSSDGKMIAHAVSDGSIWIRRTSNGKLIARLAGHEDELLKVAFSPQDTYLASGSNDGVVNLWRIEQFSLKLPRFSRLLELHHTGWVDDLAFSPDERLLAVAAHRSQLAVWQIPPGALLYNFIESINNQPNGVAFSSDGKYLATAATMGGIHIWENSQP